MRVLANAGLRSRKPRQTLKQQTGVAVITALLLTTLAITIVASLFWLQQVQVRSIENQRLQLQKKWILRGAIDWARLILREDGRTSGRIDHLGEPWAIGLAETRLDQYVENGRDSAEAAEVILSGQIFDAQGRFNLSNLATAGEPDLREIACLARLLSNLRLPTELAPKIAQLVADAQTKSSKAEQAGPNPNPGTGNPANPGDGSASNPASNPANPNPIPVANPSAENTERAAISTRLLQIDDLLVLPGVSVEMLRQLRNYLVVLPVKTSVNLNTAPAEVIAARVEGFSVADGAAIVAARERVYFRDLVDFKSRFENAKNVRDTDLSVMSNYFLILGRVRMYRSSLNMSALIERDNNNATSVLWLREN